LTQHAKPYPLKAGTYWKVIVPIRGKLTARVCERNFASRDEAIDWLETEEARLQIEVLRGRPYQAETRAPDERTNVNDTGSSDQNRLV